MTHASSVYIDKRKYIESKCVQSNLDKELTQRILEYSEVYEHQLFTDRLDSLQSNFLRHFKGLSLGELSWETMCKQLSFRMPGLNGNLLRAFYKHLLDQGLYLGQYTKYLKENPWLFDEPAQCAKKLLYCLGANPKNLYRIYYKYKNCYIYFDFNANSQSIRNLLKEFVTYRMEMASRFKELYTFVFEFENSIKGLTPQLSKAEDFNYHVFNHQFNFYSKVIAESQNQKRIYTTASILKEFYLFLLKHLKELEKDPTVIFPLNCRIDEYFLLRPNFVSEYASGGRVVRYNPFDETPKIDVWILAPNGNEEKSLGTHKDSYIQLDFRPIQDETTRSLVKEYIWTSTKGNISLKGKRNTFEALINYFKWAEKYLIELKSKGKVVEIDKAQNTSSISDNMFKNYYSYLKLAKTDGTFGQYWCSLRNFVKFFKDKYYPIKGTIFDYVIVPGYRNGNPNPLSRDEVNLLINKVQELRATQTAAQNFELEITFTIIQILLSTNFRIQEILNLKRFCLDKVEVIKDGSYPVWMQRKGSSGKYTAEPTDKFVYTVLESAIAKTELMAINAGEAISEYLFLVKGARSNSVSRITLHWFSKRFKKLTKSIGLEEKRYTPYNLRDTYMTELLLETRKKGKNILEALPLTTHAAIETAFAHYDKPDIRDFLEAFSGIIIGNVTLQGKIVETVEDAVAYEYSDINEITVKDGCGVCGEPHCKYLENDNNVDCLLCKSFRVPVDRLPLFLEAAKDLDREIAEESKYHEKEHLTTKKKLYLAYVGAIYKFKENLKKKR